MLKHGDGRVQRGLKIGVYFIEEVGAVVQSVLMTEQGDGKTSRGGISKAQSTRLTLSPVEINGNVQFTFSILVTSRGAELSQGAFKSPTLHICKEQLEE